MATCNCTGACRQSGVCPTAGLMWARPRTLQDDIDAQNNTPPSLLSQMMGNWGDGGWKRGPYFPERDELWFTPPKDRYRLHCIQFMDGTLRWWVSRMGFASEISQPTIVYPTPAEAIAAVLPRTAIQHMRYMLPFAGDTL